MCEMTILSASAGRAVLMRHDQLAQVESLTGKPVDTVVYVAPEPLTGEESTLKQRATDQWSGGGGLQFMRLPVSALSQSDGSPNP